MDLLSKVRLKKDLPNCSYDYSKRVSEEETGSIEYMKSIGPKWTVPDGLKKKISLNGELLPFFGDTVVYTLPQRPRDIVTQFQTKLRRELDFLAEPLNPSQFHMTIHDLSNGPRLKELESGMSINRNSCKELFKKISLFLKNSPKENIIKMKSVAIFPCVNTSLLIGVAPETESDYKKLLNIYNAFDDLVFLNYWPRFHITLDYYKLIELTVLQMNHLGTTVNNVYREFSFEVNINDIVYQHFYNMNDYRDQFAVSDC